MPELTNVNKNIIGYGLFLMIIASVVVGEYGPLLYPLGHDIIYWIVIEIIAIVSILRAILNPQKPFLFPHFSWVIIFFMLFWLAFLIATIFSPQKSISFWGSLIRSDGLFSLSHFLVLFMLIVTFVKAEKKWLEIFSVAAILSILATSLAIFGKVTGEHIRVFSTFGNPNFFAGYLLLVIFVTLILSFYERGRVLKIIYILAFLLEGGALILTFSRAAYFGLFAGITALIILMPNINARMRQIALTFIAIFILVFAIIKISGRAEYAQTVLPDIFYDRFVSERSEIYIFQRIEAWISGLEGTALRPFFGWGPENFQLAFQAGYNGTLDNSGFNGRWFDKAHNILVEIMATSGILGLASFLALFLFMLYKNIRLSLSSANEFTRYAGAGVASTLIAYSIHNFFNFDTASTFLYFTIFAAWSAVAPCPEFAKSTLKETLPKFSRLQPFILYPVSLVILLIIFINVHGPIILSNYNLNLAVSKFHRNPSKAFQYFENGLSKNSAMTIPYIRTRYAGALFEHSQLIKSTNTRGAINELKTALQLTEQNINNQTPMSLWDHMLAASITSALSEVGEPHYKKMADQYFGKALKLSPRSPNTLVLWARSDIKHGDFQSARKKLLQAIFINSLNAESYWTLGLIEIFENREKSANRYFIRAEDLGVNLSESWRVNEIAIANAREKN